LVNTQSAENIILKLFYYFLIPQNFLLVLIIFFSGFKYDLYESFILINNIGFIFIHLPAKIYPEYLISLYPMLSLLAVLRFEKINNFKLFKTYSLNSLRKAFLILFILCIPFSVQYLFFYIQNKNFGINPVELYYFNSKLDELSSNSVIASWLGLLCIFKQSSCI
jgi:hypothetical protein